MKTPFTALLFAIAFCGPLSSSVAGKASEDRPSADKTSTAGNLVPWPAGDTERGNGK